MKKKLTTILSIILILFLMFFIIYKINSNNRMKERAINHVQELINSISNNDYDQIKFYIKNPDGTELTDQQVSNFLLNTSLYRITLHNNQDKIFTYSTWMNFWDSHNVSITFNVTALNGEVITNTVKFLNNGTNEYIIAEKTYETNKEKERYPIALDLANGKTIEYNGIANEENKKINIISFIKEDDKIFIEVNKEAKEDVKMAMINLMSDLEESLKSVNKQYNITWDDQLQNFSVYYEESAEQTLIAATMQTEMLYCSSVFQGLSGNSDWHLNINYYDYSTMELLKTEKIR